MLTVHAHPLSSSIFVMFIALNIIKAACNNAYELIEGGPAWDPGQRMKLNISIGQVYFL